MAVDFVSYSGLSNTGFKKTRQEDFILINDTAFGDDILFASVADGAGSKESTFDPASIVSLQVENNLSRIYSKNKDLLLANSKFFIEEAFLSANNTLVGFKLGDESARFGYASTLSCILLERNGVMTFGHVGNTRIYLVRNNSIFQLTKDHTEGQKLVDKGIITEENYYTAIERLRLYNGMGISKEPSVQSAKIKLQKNDVIIMTSDGIHYSFRSEHFVHILMNTVTVDEAAEEMIETALQLRNFPDNICVNIIWYKGEK